MKLGCYKESSLSLSIEAIFLIMYIISVFFTLFYFQNYEKLIVYIDRWSLSLLNEKYMVDISKTSKSP